MKNREKRCEENLKHGSSRVYLLVILFIITVAILMLYKMYNSGEKYLVNEGVIEYTTSCIGYVIKDETILDIDNSKVIVPTVSEGSRVSKNNIIATYRGLEYENYQNKLQEIDNKILQAMQDINIEYSVEVSNLETQVVNTVISANGISSMIEMQEYKTNINELLSKRASIIGELSPEDAYVKDLIKQREDLETELKTSSSNVRAPIGGIISYTIDGLEDKLTKESIMNLNYEDVKEYVKNSKAVTSSKIKITSNYEAYVFVRANNVSSEYIEEGKKYQIKIMGEELSELTGTIVKITETEQGYEVLFRVTNGIENIINSRECEVEVVWTTYEGLVVPIKAIKEKDDKSYVTIITRGEYVDIPVKVQRKNKTYAIVENYEKENINDYILERYDQVLIESK